MTNRRITKSRKLETNFENPILVKRGYHMSRPLCGSIPGPIAPRRILWLWVDQLAVLERNLRSENRFCFRMQSGVRTQPGIRHSLPNRWCWGRLLHAAGRVRCSGQVYHALYHTSSTVPGPPKPTFDLHGWDWADSTSAAAFLRLLNRFCQSQKTLMTPTVRAQTSGPLRCHKTIGGQWWHAHPSPDFGPRKWFLRLNGGTWRFLGCVREGNGVVIICHWEKEMTKLSFHHVKLW